MRIIDANNKNFIYYVTEPCYNGNPKPLRASDFSYRALLLTKVFIYIFLFEII